MIRPKDWKPQGISDLEPAAWDALREPGNVCVVAGPGSGKTEFLAQKATYLLQTGLCPAPLKILALSFKRDAATNLARRVRQRCPPDQANRFTSLTFDAFAKSLVDRFLPAIPAAWRPAGPYNLAFPKYRDYQEFLRGAQFAAPPAWQTEIAGYAPTTFESGQVGAMRLQVPLPEPATARDFAAARWWQQYLGARRGPLVTFIMLNRLAELLLRSRPEILRALRATYPFVFLDEFQDATFAQYDLLLTAFFGTPAVHTAVGDDKQRIMVWAGARPDAFPRFEADFKAKRISLVFNHRSSPGLVRIQHVVARYLDKASAEPVSKADAKIDDDVAQIWSFCNEPAEGKQIATWIAGDMKKRGLVQRDYAVLVRQTADRFENQLAPHFVAAGLRLRNESRMVGHISIQDLLAEDLTRIVATILRLAVQPRAPAAWSFAAQAMRDIHPADPDDPAANTRVERELKRLVKNVRTHLAAEPPSVESAKTAAAIVFAALDLSAVARTFVQYGRGDDLAIAAESIPLYLAECAAKAPDWRNAVDEFEGVDQVPLMTVHKGKGLEYDTMIFAGLDDKMWWAHKRGDYEGGATFFVALSRAKQRAVFTFCAARGSRDGVSDLYGLLAAAGVKEVKF